VHVVMSGADCIMLSGNESEGGKIKHQSRERERERTKCEWVIEREKEREWKLKRKRERNKMKDRETKVNEWLREWETERQIINCFYGYLRQKN
jgi:collagenase-like PrtC family protease